MRGRCRLKSAILVFAGLSISCSTAAAQEPQPHPILNREQFLSYAAGAVVAGMYCGKLELNADFFLGYEYATGVYPPLDPNFRPEMARVEKDAKSDLDSYCKLARLMFYKGNKPKPLAAPLLVDKQ
ncbi:hypothetical protein ELG83_33330 (plasmid) [Rhizobium leguminosarum]|nr:hypothetical protein ELH76_19810 [Rhizobium ruizarguesonis]TBB21280.1 hypothetical protein ELH51_05520 [Rhizobium ruizarguesonis]TBF87049.1 hypothetical protein ELG83_33330 [Rhizobium leguminosarum]